MSITLMSAAWEVDLPDSEKLVLLALADWANDDGGCWPSIARLALKCSKSERTIQTAIGSLVFKGQLTRKESRGKGCVYTIHPRKDCTPAKTARVQGATKTPAAAAPNTSGHTNIMEEGKPSPIKRGGHYPPPGVSDEQWQGFVQHRRAHKKGGPLNAHAYKLLCAKLVKLADAGWPPGDMIDLAIERGWITVFEPLEQNGNRNGRREEQSGGLGRTARAAIAAFGH